MKTRVKFQIGLVLLLVMLVGLTACGDTDLPVSVPATSPTASVIATTTPTTTQPSKSPTTAAPTATLTGRQPTATPTAASWDKLIAAGEQKWQDANLKNYRIVIEHQSGQTAGTSYDLTVRDGVMTTEKNSCDNPRLGNCLLSFAEYSGGTSKLPVAILFQLSRANVKELGNPQKPVYIDLTFDEKYGFPKNIYNSPLYASDSQISFKVKSFEVL